MLKRKQRRASDAGAAVIGSITVAAATPAAQLARLMAEVVSAVEVNVGAPHGREAAAVRQFTDAQGVAHYVSAIRGHRCTADRKAAGPERQHCRDGASGSRRGADAVSMIGRLNGFVPDLNTWQPLLG